MADAPVMSVYQKQTVAAASEASARAEAAAAAQEQADARLAWQLHQQMQLQSGRASADKARDRREKEQWEKVEGGRGSGNSPAMTKGGGGGGGGGGTPNGRGGVGSPAVDSPATKKKALGVGTFALLASNDGPSDDESDEEEDASEAARARAPVGPPGSVLGMTVSAPYWDGEADNAKHGRWFVSLVGQSGASTPFQLGSVLHRMRKLDKAAAPELLLLEKEECVQEFRCVVWSPSSCY